MGVVSHQTVRLARGRHEAPGRAGVCALELASMLAGEPFTDHPRAVAPTVAALLRGYNDGLDDVRRQELRPLVAACVGTRRGRSVERRRRRELRQALAGLGIVASGLTGLRLRAGLTTGYFAGRTVGLQVVAQDDDGLHGRTVALLAGLAAMGADDPVAAATWTAPAGAPGAPDAPVRRRP